MSDAFLVGAATDVAKLAGAIASKVRESGTCEVRAIGAGAVNQAVKAIAVARGYAATDGRDLAAVPSFFKTTGDGGVELTGIQLLVRC